MRFKHVAALLACVALVGSLPLSARPSRSAIRHSGVDLADVVQGSYYGDVISDSRGSSRTDVTITVTKTAPGTVLVSSSYRRLPSFTVHLTRAMKTIQQASGNNVFLIDQAKSPWSLDLTVDGVSWWGRSGDQIS
jgi:hypothetical protein